MKLEDALKEYLESIRSTDIDDADRTDSTDEDDIYNL